MMNIDTIDMYTFQHILLTNIYNCSQHITLNLAAAAQLGVF